jgi:hypothetical protein
VHTKQAPICCAKWTNDFLRGIFDLAPTSSSTYTTRLWRLLWLCRMNFLLETFLTYSWITTVSGTEASGVHSSEFGAAFRVRSMFSVNVYTKHISCTGISTGTEHWPSTPKDDKLSPTAWMQQTGSDRRYKPCKRRALYMQIHIWIWLLYLALCMQKEDYFANLPLHSVTWYPDTRHRSLTTCQVQDTDWHRSVNKPTPTDRLTT